MNTALVFYAVYLLFYCFMNRYHYLTVKSNPEDIAALDHTLWIKDGIISALSTFFLLVVRLTGIAFLLFLGIQTIWYMPIIVFVIGLPLAIVLQSILNRFLGHALPALAGFLVLPIMGPLMFVALAKRW